MSLKRPLTEAEADVHMEEWGLIAQEVGFERLAAAVRQVMRNDTDWFPCVKTIRERVGLNEENRLDVEVDSAWEYVQQHLRKWGVGDLPIWSGGKPVPFPRLPPLIEYAVRALGGLRVMNQVDADRLPFMRKDFAEAYKRAPLAGEMRLQLTGAADNKKLEEFLHLSAVMK